jgi:HEAT repeat protein
MLTYALSLKSLRVTGRKPSSIPALTAPEVDEVIAAGRDFFTSKNGYQQRTVNALLSGLSSWSPSVRLRSAQGLSRHEGDFVPTLLKMLAGPDRDARYGACEALRFLGPRADAAAPQLRMALEHPDPWLQSLACRALPMLGPEARKASVSNLLKMSMNPGPDDPRRMAQRAACMALFAPYPGSRGYQSILAESLEGVDRQQLYPAIRSVLDNEDGAARGSLSRIYGKLTDRDLIELMPAILKAIDRLAPSNEMFGDGIRLAGLDLVSRLHIREGLPLCLSVMEPDRWGAGTRIPKCLEYLVRYGVHAKEFLPQLQDLRPILAKAKRGQGEESTLLDKTIATITASTVKPKLLSLDEFVKQGK